MDDPRERRSILRAPPRGLKVRANPLLIGDLW